MNGVSRLFPELYPDIFLTNVELFFFFYWDVIVRFSKYVHGVFRYVSLPVIRVSFYGL